MKLNEIRRKYRIFVTGTAMAALLAVTTACGAQTSAGASAAAESSVTSEAAAESEVTAETTEERDATGEAAEESDVAGESAGSAETDNAEGNTEAETSTANISNSSAEVTPGPARDSIATSETIENSSDGEHAIMADGEALSYANTSVTKTGDTDSGDEADFYGENAAVFATNGGTLDLTQMVIETNGKHANGVFSYGEGTTVNISDSYITTSGDCSGGLMTTGGGTMNAENLTIETNGRSSAAIRSDRGGGTVNVDGGSYTTNGVGSPVVYSTADITVSNAEMTSTASQGVVVEGKNSVTLNNVDLTADNNQKNSDHSDYYQAVMIYQSMSGDAAQGTSSFSMNGGTMTNLNGDVFFITNTATTIDLNGAEIVNNGDGVFLRAAAAGWGKEGSNGGHVALTAADEEINGDMVTDDVSEMNLYLKDGSTFTGAVNTDGAAGSVYVEIEDGSAWILTGDSHITSLTCGSDAIDLNGYTLYVGDAVYEEGAESTGEAIEIVSASSGNQEGNGAPDGQGGPGENGMTPPDGNGGQGGPGGNGMTPPDGNGGQGGPGGNGMTPPDGNGGQGGPGGNGMTPPEKPDGQGGPGQTSQTGSDENADTDSGTTADQN